MKDEIFSYPPSKHADMLCAVYPTPSPNQTWLPALKSLQTLTPNTGLWRRDGGRDATKPSTGPSSGPRTGRLRTRTLRGRKTRARWSWVTWRGGRGGRRGGGGTRACWASLCAGRWPEIKQQVAAWEHWVQNHSKRWRKTSRSAGGWWRRRFSGWREPSLCWRRPKTLRGWRSCWTATGRRWVLQIWLIPIHENFI